MGVWPYNKHNTRPYHFSLLPPSAAAVKKPTQKPTSAPSTNPIRLVTISLGVTSDASDIYAWALHLFGFRGGNLQTPPSQTGLAALVVAFLLAVMDAASAAALVPLGR